MIENAEFHKKLKVVACALVWCFCVAAAGSHVEAQSSDQNYPTPVISNEINGVIKARDIGDARLTTHFYVFNGTQGDVFINVVTNNFNGDIDVFNAANLNPLTKIVVYAGDAPNETGRIVYLRKPEKLILRIQGRTPNDDPATYAIKFAGSFKPASELAQAESPEAPKVERKNDSDVIVNSVGTIIGVKPKPSSTPKDVVDEQAKNVSEAEKTEEIQPSERLDDEEKKVEAGKSKVVITDELEKSKPKTSKTKEIDKAEAVEKADDRKPVEQTAEKSQIVTEEKEEKAEKKAKSKTGKNETANALAEIRLIVIFKNGSKIERPMSEVSRVNVDNKGVLTIVSKDGSIGRYSILDVVKMTIE